MDRWRQLHPFFLAANRYVGHSLNIIVTLGGTTLGVVTPPSDASFSAMQLPFRAPTGAAVLQFQGFPNTKLSNQWSNT
jgi:hypothetical protein